MILRYITLLAIDIAARLIKLLPDMPEFGEGLTSAVQKTSELINMVSFWVPINTITTIITLMFAIMGIKWAWFITVFLLKRVRGG